MTEIDIKALQEAISLLDQVRQFIPKRVFSENSYEHRTVSRIMEWHKHYKAEELNAKLNEIFTIQLTEPKLIQETADIDVKKESVLKDVISAGELRGYLYKMMAKQHEHIIEIDVPDKIKHNNVSKIIINWKSGIDESMKGLSQIVKWLISVKN